MFFKVLELNIESLEPEKIGSLESEKWGSYRFTPVPNISLKKNLINLK